VSWPAQFRRPASPAHGLRSCYGQRAGCDEGYSRVACSTGAQNIPFRWYSAAIPKKHATLALSPRDEAAFSAPSMMPPGKHRASSRRVSFVLNVIETVFEQHLLARCQRTAENPFSPKFREDFSALGVRGLPSSCRFPVWGIGRVRRGERRRVPTVSHTGVFRWGWTVTETNSASVPRGRVPRAPWPGSGGVRSVSDLMAFFDIAYLSKTTTCSVTTLPITGPRRLALPMNRFMQEAASGLGELAFHALWRRATSGRITLGSSHSMTTVRS
jgi:hypothetical protein